MKPRTLFIILGILLVGAMIYQVTEQNIGKTIFLTLSVIALTTLGAYLWKKFNNGG